MEELLTFPVIAGVGLVDFFPVLGATPGRPNVIQHGNGHHDDVVQSQYLHDADRRVLHPATRVSRLTEWHCACVAGLKYFPSGVCIGYRKLV